MQPVRALKPKDKFYKVVDRDGMYVVVQPSGVIVFRYDYRLNGRRETLTLGRYGSAGLSLARAREQLIDAKRAISEGRSPAQEKQREKRRLKEAKSYSEFAERWFEEARMADSTRAMRRSIYERDVLPAFRNRLGTSRRANHLVWTSGDRVVHRPPRPISNRETTDRISAIVAAIVVGRRST